MIFESVYDVGLFLLLPLFTGIVSFIIGFIFGMYYIKK